MAEILFRGSGPIHPADLDRRVTAAWGRHAAGGGQGALGTAALAVSPQSNNFGAGARAEALPMPPVSPVIRTVRAAISWLRVRAMPAAPLGGMWQWVS